MWPKSYKDYLKDQELIKYRVEPGKGIIGCEMHELNGWGISYELEAELKTELKTIDNKIGHSP